MSMQGPVSRTLRRWPMRRLRASAARAACALAIAVTTGIGGQLLISSQSAASDSTQRDSATRVAAEKRVAMPVLRRLTRTEYANSLRDLFGIDFPFVAELPADAQTGGFDNNGETLSVSPLLLEAYLNAARKASDMILGTGSAAAVTEIFPATGSQFAWLEGLPMGTRGGLRAAHYFPRTGEYELRAFLDTMHYSGGRRRSAALNPKEGVRFFRARMRVPAGSHTFIVTFPADYAAGEGAVFNLDTVDGRGLGGPLDIRGSAIRPTLQFWLDGKKIATFEIQGPTIGEAAFEAQPGAPILSRAEIMGPFDAAAAADAPARRKLMSCKPRPRSEQACASKILAAVARRAYRRDVTADDMQPIMAAFSPKRQSADFDVAIGMGLRRILVSPDFLFRLEQDPPGGRPGEMYRISDGELAVRLSYFLWSSIPDDELLEQGQRGRLQDAATLGRQVRRLLADPRAQALVDNFALQWLGIPSVDSLRPDPALYPYFAESLREDFKQETRLYLRSLMQENRSVLDLISSDYTFLNERLAKHYGIDGVYGDAFRPVHLTDTGARGGLISHASVLMLTSHPAQTSPILRGKWILANLLNAPPPPPPSGVPPLDSSPASDGRQLSVRQQIERHRASPVCAGCHVKMDPYGVALENYDVVGRWRTEENGAPIDVSAQLPRGGGAFVGPAGLKKILLSRPDEFAAAVTSRLMAYALGRGLEESDRAAVQSIVEQTKPYGYRFADIVLGVVNSPPFQMRHVASEPAEDSRT